MTEDDLLAIEARHAAATGGEWTWEDDPPTVYAGRSNYMHGLNLFGRLHELDWNGHANLDFITHAHQDVPALVAEVRRLRAIIGTEDTHDAPQERKITKDH